jgi:hypothetical protein
MTLLIKIQSKTFSDDSLHVVASVENDIGTLVGSYILNMPEQSSDDEIKGEILKIYT